MSSPRDRFEDASRGPLVALNRMPKPLVVIGMAALLVGGLLAPNPIGPFLLLLIGIFLGWLVALSWPVLLPAQRLIRVITVALVIGAAWLRATGRG